MRTGAESPISVYYVNFYDNSLIREFLCQYITDAIVVVYPKQRLCEC